MEHIDKVKGIYPSKRPTARDRAVSPAVIRRLPRYHRYLGQLLREGRARISSSELSEMMCVTASQIRQDLNCFGGFGQQGYGYHVQYLYDRIGELLGAEEHYRAVWSKTFDIVKEKFYSGDYDMVVLDEVIDAYNLGVIDKEDLHAMMDNRPAGTELVITGHQYGMDLSELFRRADYITKFVKEKHPFDEGMPCRTGIEE